MTQADTDEISMIVAQNQYYAAIVSIVFVAGATSSIVLGLSLGVILILFYALFIPVGVTLSSKGVVIQNRLRKSRLDKSAVKFLISGEDKKRVLVLTFPSEKRYRQIQVLIDNERELIEWLGNHKYEIGNTT